MRHYSAMTVEDTGNHWTKARRGQRLHHFTLKSRSTLKCIKEYVHILIDSLC